RAPMSPESPIQAVNLGPNGSAFCVSCYLGRRALPCLSTRTIRFLLRLGLKTHRRRLLLLGYNSKFSTQAPIARLTQLSRALRRPESTHSWSCPTICSVLVTCNSLRKQRVMPCLRFIPAASTLKSAG